MEKISLYVANLTCPGCNCGCCATALTNALEGLDHVDKVEPDFVFKKITIAMHHLDTKSVLDKLKESMYEGVIL
jgi:copper chaperone CopZ